MLGLSWGPRWAIFRLEIGTRGSKRAQEGPKSVLGSGPEATLRHTYDLIDSKTLKGTKNDVLYVENVRFTLYVFVFFEQSSYRSLL